VGNAKGKKKEKRQKGVEQLREGTEERGKGREVRRDGRGGKTEDMREGEGEVRNLAPRLFLKVGAYDSAATPSDATSVAMGDQLTDKQRNQLTAPISQHGDVFTGKLGCANVSQHRILVFDQKCCFQLSYKTHMR